MHDIRYALRTLRRTPGFTITAVVILALGIGANTAIFSLVSAMVLRPLPFPEPDRLVMVWDDLRSRGGPPRVEPTLAEVVEWRTHSRSFAGLAVYLPVDLNLTGDGEPQRLAGMRATTNLFATLGLQPVLGRSFAADDEGADALPVAVISTTLWQRRFGADPRLIGRTLVLNGVSRTVVGVVPPDLRFPAAETSVWIPAAFTPAELAQRGNYVNYVIGRLKPGVTRAAAQAELTEISRQARTAPGASAPRTATVLVADLKEQLTFLSRTRPTLYVLFGAVAVLLLIACANVANLLLVRGARRVREVAVRKALGAATGRVVRQLLIESALVAAAGVAIGTAAALLSFGYLGRLVPGVMPDAMRLGLDWRVLTFTAGVAAATVLLFGTGPAWLVARRDVASALKSQAATAVSSRGRLRGVLVVAEIALTVVLLSGAGLLIRSYAAVLAVDPGFRADHLLVAETVLAPTRYADRGARAAFYHRVLEGVRAIPGVLAAGYVNVAPLTFKGGRTYVRIEGRPAPRSEDAQKQVIANRVITPGYHEALGVPLLRGRYITARDDATAPTVLLVNDSMARRLFANEDAVGKRVRFGGEGVEAPWMTVVGVVGDVRQMGLDVPAEPELYLAADQVPVVAAFFWPKDLIVRTQGDPLAVARAVRQTVWNVDPTQPVEQVRAMGDVLSADLEARTTQLTLLAVFAALALVLAAVGMYGVLAYSVSQRTPEIALRLALGAPPGQVLRSVVRSALQLVVVGLALGALGALVGTPALASFLYSVRPNDPVTMAAVTVVLLLVAMAASVGPAWRAAHVEPATALRAD